MENIDFYHYCFITGSIITAKLTCVIKQEMGLQRPNIKPSLILYLKQLTNIKDTLNRNVFLGSVPFKMKDYKRTIPSISPFKKSL